MCFVFFVIVVEWYLHGFPEELRYSVRTAILQHNKCDHCGHSLFGLKTVVEASDGVRE